MRAASTIVVLCGVFATADPAFAQRDLEIPIQFDFINPGARSLGLAGAFIGVADDATAATTNPAGLLRLSRPEVSVEARGWQFITEFIQGGRIEGVATGRGIDTLDGAEFGETTEQLAGLSYLSFVYPRGAWRFAGYRQVASKLRSTAENRGVFFTEPFQGRTFDFREFPSQTDRAIDVVNYGGSVAVRSGIVNVGAGVFLSQFSYESTLTGFDIPGDIYQPVALTSPLYTNTQTADDLGVGVNVGILISPSEVVQVGASYRRGASFTFEGDLNFPEFPAISGSYSGPFKVPDNLGVGVAIRPLQGLTFALDVNRVTYSDLNEFIQTQVRFQPTQGSLYSVDDATEIHFGAEYVATRFRITPIVRGGVWHETDHAVQYAGDDPFYAASSTLAGDITHVAIGGGIVPNQRLELNGGLDFSERGNTFSFSAIVRF